VDWSYVYIVSGGLLSLLMTVWIWRGRGPQARSWVRFPFIGDLASFMAFPTFGAICVGAGLHELGVPDWLSILIFLAENIPGHLWLNEHGIFFDPSKSFPPNVYPPRTTWRNLQHFERHSRTLTVTFLKWGKPQTHTFSMPRLRAQRAEQHILERYESQTESD